MSNPVELLYGSYSPFDHAKAQVLDPELNCYQPLDYVVPAGASNRVYDTVQSSTQTSTQTQSFIRQMTLEDMTSSWVTLASDVALTFPSAWGGVSKAALATYIDEGNLFMGQFPLQQACSNIQCIIAGTTMSLDPSTLASSLLKGYKDLERNPYIQQWPSAPDTSASYTAGAATYRPNVNPLDTATGVQTRNLYAFDWSFIETNPVSANCLGIRVRWEEAPLLDIFSLVRDGKAALSGINQIQFILSFAAPVPKASDNLPTASPGQPLERVFSGVFGAPLAALVGGPFSLQQILSLSTITFASIPEMRFIQYSQNLSWPLYNMYSRPYADYSTGYQNQNIQDVTVAQIANGGRQPQTLFTAAMNSQTLLEIPKMFVIWTGYQGSYRRAWDPSWCGVPQNIAMRFAGAQNLLASASPRELFNLSKKNGLNMSWYEAQQCGFPLFLLPSDLGLTAGALILEGVTGSFQVQIQTLNCLTPLGFNTSSGPITLTNLQVHMIPVYSNEFQINNNRANIVSVAGMNANDAVKIPFVDSSNAEVQSVLSGGNFLESVEKGFKRLVSSAQMAAPHMMGIYKDVKPIAEDIIAAHKSLKGSGATRRITFR